MTIRQPKKTTRKAAGGALAPPARWVDRKPVRLRLVPADAESRQAVKALGYAPIGEPVLIGLAPQDARHHVHMPGPTGTGKTTLLLNVAVADARAGRGLAVFDPKGDLIRDLLARLPASAAGRLVLIDPDEREAPPALNLFNLADDPEAVADQLVGVMAKVWAQYWGPRTDDLARHAVLTLAHVPGATLADLPILLADASYRRRVMTGVRRRLGPVGAAGLVAFWAWYDSLTPAAASVQVGPLLSKLRAVLSRRFAAQLFGAGASTFRLADILDGGILLVRLPPSLGDDTVRLVGSLLLAALLHTAQRRADLPEDDRLDASLILDEAHTFLHLPVGVDDALAQARALRLGLVLAHQHLGQLSGRMAEAIDANARNKVFFALSPKDARDLAHHVTPYFAPEDLQHRDAYGIVCRLVIDGRDSEPFTLATRPAPPAWPGRAEALRAAARARGLPQADREAIANARRVGPDPRTPQPAQPEDPTHPTGDRPADPTSPTDPGPIGAARVLPAEADDSGDTGLFAPAPGAPPTRHRQTHAPHQPSERTLTVFTIPNLPLLDIAPAVAALLGSEAAILRVFDTAEAGYVCTVCGQAARLTDTDPAAVVVLAFPDAPHLVRLAHDGCSGSGIVAMTDDPDTNPAMLFPAMAWLRPANTDPAPVLVIAPHVYGMRVAANGEATDTLTASLLGYGFGLLSRPEAPLPDLDAVTAYLGGDNTLTLTDAGDDVLWSGVIDPPDGWNDTARTAGRIGVVFAAGLVLDDPHPDRLAGLFTAIGDGRAVAASVELDTDITESA